MKHAEAGYFSEIFVFKDRLYVLSDKDFIIVFQLN